MNLQPFQLPLNPNDFSTALQSGHGRALLHVLEHGCKGVEDLILALKERVVVAPLLPSHRHESEYVLPYVARPC